MNINNKKASFLSPPPTPTNPQLDNNPHLRPPTILASPEMSQMHSTPALGRDVDFREDGAGVRDFPKKNYARRSNVTSKGKELENIQRVPPKYDASDLVPTKEQWEEYEVQLALARALARHEATLSKPMRQGSEEYQEFLDNVDIGAEIEALRGPKYGFPHAKSADRAIYNSDDYRVEVGGEGDNEKVNERGAEQEANPRGHNGGQRHMPQRELDDLL